MYRLATKSRQSTFPNFQEMWRLGKMGVRHPRKKDVKEVVEGFARERTAEEDLVSYVWRAKLGGR